MQLNSIFYFVLLQQKNRIKNLINFNSLQKVIKQQKETRKIFQTAMKNKIKNLERIKQRFEK